MLKLLSIRIFGIPLVVLGIALPSFGQAPAAPKASPTMVVHAGHYIDGTTAERKGAVTVTLQAGRIVSVQPGTVNVPGAQAIELGDATLMPGLIDVHKHMGAPRTGLNPFQGRLTISTPGGRSVPNSTPARWQACSTRLRRVARSGSVPR